MLRSPLFHFLLVGALLFGLQRIGSWFTESQNPSVVEVHRSEIDARISAYQKQMGRVARDEEARSIENQVVDDLLWLDQAWALGLERTDPIVRQRLILNMQFLEDGEGASEDDLVQRAISLGMDRSDVVVQRRLVDRVQAMIRAGVRSRRPDDEMLRRHFEKTSSRWREPVLLDLTHVYFSRDKRGAASKQEAEALLPRLIDDGIAPTDAVLMADPFLSGHDLRGATPNRIVARLGPDFAAGVSEAPVRRWVGPVDSAFGNHLVWIHERVESRIPRFEEVRERVLNDWFEAKTREALRVQLERRRQIVEVRVIEDVE